MKKESNQNLSGNKVDYTNSLTLLVKNMLCITLHARERERKIESERASERAIGRERDSEKDREIDREWETVSELQRKSERARARAREREVHGVCERETFVTVGTDTAARYRDTSLIRNRSHPWYHQKTLGMALLQGPGGGSVSCERGTPVCNREI